MSNLNPPTMPKAMRNRTPGVNPGTLPVGNMNRGRPMSTYNSPYQRGPGERGLAPPTLSSVRSVRGGTTLYTPPPRSNVTPTRNTTVPHRIPVAPALGAIPEDKPVANTQSIAPAEDKTVAATNSIDAAGDKTAATTNFIAPAKDKPVAIADVIPPAEHKTSLTKIVPSKQSGPPPSAPPAQSSAGFWSGARGFLNTLNPLLPGQMEIQVSWHCPNFRISHEEKTIIEDSAIAIAKQERCDVLRIRSDIHNTTFVGSRNRHTGRKEVSPAAWHYTLEMQHVDTHIWKSAHVYTDTVIKQDTRGMPVKATQGLKLPDGFEVKENPQIWSNVNPAASKNNYGSFSRRA